MTSCFKLALRYLPTPSLLGLQLAPREVASLVSRFQIAADRDAVATARDVRDAVRRSSFVGRRASGQPDDAVAAAVTGAAALAVAAAALNPSASASPSTSPDVSHPTSPIASPPSSALSAGRTGNASNDGPTEPRTDPRPSSGGGATPKTPSGTGSAGPRGPAPLVPIAPNIPSDKPKLDVTRKDTHKPAVLPVVGVNVPTIVDVPPTPVEPHVVKDRTHPNTTGRARRKSATRTSASPAPVKRQTAPPASKKPASAGGASAKTVRPRLSTSRLNATPRTSSSASTHVSAPTEPAASPVKQTVASLAKTRPRASSPLSPEHASPGRSTTSPRPRSSLSASPPRITVVTTPANSRLLQGTAASRARAAATAAASPSKNTPPAKARRSSRSSPKATVLGTPSSGSGSKPPPMGAVGRSPIGRLGLAAAREARQPGEEPRVVELHPQESAKDREAEAKVAEAEKPEEKKEEEEKKKKKDEEKKEDEDEDEEDEDEKKEDDEDKDKEEPAE